MEGCTHHSIDNNNVKGCSSFERERKKASQSSKWRFARVNNDASKESQCSQLNPITVNAAKISEQNLLSQREGQEVFHLQWNTLTIPRQFSTIFHTLTYTHTQMAHRPPRKSTVEIGAVNN